MSLQNCKSSSGSFDNENAIPIIPRTTTASMITFGTNLMVNHQQLEESLQ